MKELPAYKKIAVKSINDLNSAKFRKELDNFSHPIVIDLLSLPDLDYALLQYIESKIINYVKSTSFPYPIYLLTTLGDYKGRLTSFASINDLPKFFPQKVKNFSKLHHGLLLYNSIGEREYECINFTKAQQVLEEYAVKNKIIILQQEEISLLDFIIKKLNPAPLNPEDS